MLRKIVAVWVSLTMLFGFVVIVDVITDYTPQVKATTLYVNTTGSGGAYTSIQDAINASSDGDTVFVYNGTYNEIVTVNKCINLIGQNKNNTIIDGENRMVDVVTITEDWVNVTGLTITGAIGGNTFSGIKLENVHNAKIFNVNASDNGKGIFLLQSSYTNITNNIISKNFIGVQLEYSSEDNIIRNNIMNNVYGIQVLYSSNINITNNNFINDGISIKGNHLNHYYTHTIPDNNLINGKSLYYYKDCVNKYIDGTSIGQIILVNCSAFNIINVSINNTDMGIIIAYSMNVSITNSNIIKNDNAITISFSQSVTINNNSLSMNRIYGIFIYKNSNDNLITNNNASSNRHGIMMGINCSTNNVSNNIFIDNFYTGISIGGLCLFNNITNNTVNNNGDGILLGPHSERNIIANNEIFSNDNRGINFELAYKNIITRNNIKNNSEGINLSHSSDANYIFGNSITSNNKYGLFLYESSNNSIYHNNFQDNKYQAYDSRDNNYWDDGYPSGGNYWSDYIGVDNNKGPNQDIPGSDGIGDTPYIIDADSQDNYPLMEPFANRTFDNYTVLKQGWNQISIPLIQEEQNLTKVLEMIDGYYDAVQWFDNTVPTDSWKHYKFGKPYGNDLFKLNETLGFWIHITNPGDTIFLYNGTQPTVNQSITIHPGWNMVGYPSLSNRNRTEALNNIIFDQDVDAIWTFNAATQTWQEISPTDDFELGRGYWIHSKVTKVWDVSL